MSDFMRLDIRLIILSIYLLSFSVYSTSLSLSPSFSNSTNTNYLITIDNTNSTSNITLVNITINPFTYVYGTNSTSSVNSSFSNTTSNIYWTNITSSGFVAVNATEIFSFNLSANLEYNSTLNVSVKYQNGTLTTYYLPLFVDTIIPKINITYPNKSKNITTSSNKIINLSYEYNETYPSYMTLKILKNNSIVLNETNSSLLSGYITGNWSVNTSSLNEGIYDVRIDIYDSLGNSNYSLISNSLIIDNTPPTINLNSPENESWQPMTTNLIFQYTPFSYSGINNCTLHIFNETGSEIHNETNSSILNNQTNVFNYSINYANETKIYWNILCYNNLNMNSTSETRLINIGNRSDLVIESVTINTTYPKAGDVLKISVNITNKGTYSLRNNTNMSFYFGTSSSPCSQTPTNTSVLLNSSEFAKGYSKIIDYITPKLNNSDYYICVKADYTNKEQELNESNNQKSSHTSTLFKISIISVNDTYAKPGKNISIKMNITYYDNTPVTDLSISNISLEDKWVEGGRNVVSSSTIYEKNFTLNSQGIYEIYHTIKAHTIDKGDEYGTHNITVTISKDNITGTATSQYTYISPYLQITWSDEDTTMEVDQTNRAKVTLKNIGNEKIDIYTFKLYISSSNSDYLSASFYNCDTSKFTLDPNEYKSCYVDITAKKEGTGKRLALNASGNITNPDRYYTYKVYTSDIDISAKSTTTTTTTTNTDSTSSDNSTESSDLGDSCSKDSDCASNLYCDLQLKKCNAVKCTNGRVINHKCVSNVNINITMESVYSVLENSFKSYEIKLDNTGFKRLYNISAEATCSEIGNIFTFSDIPEYLSVTIDKTMKMNINTTKVTIGRYDCILNISTDDGYFNKSFRLIVKPNTKTKKEINETLKELDEKVNELFKYYKSLEDDIPEEIKSQIFNTVNSLILKYNKTKESIDANDYITAYNLQKELAGDILNTQNLLKQTENEIEDKTHRRLKYTIYILILLGILGGVFYYLWTPPLNEKEVNPIDQIYNKTKPESKFTQYINKLKEKLKFRNKNNQQTQTTVFQYRYNPNKK